MKYIFVFFFCLVLCPGVRGQDSAVHEQTEKDICINFNESIEEINKEKAFRKVHKIYLVSYKHEVDGSKMMPLKNGKPDMSKMFQVVVLEKEKRDEFLRLLVNHANNTGVGTVYSCYEPRNGIVFEDKNGKILGYIEMCFECHRQEIKWKAPLPAMCSEKWHMLFDAFLNAGITYGTRENDN